MSEASGNSGGTRKKRRKTIPARTPEGRMNQLISLAVDSAEERLMNGTASSQIITTLLNLATTKAQLELEKMRSDVELSKAKAKAIEEQETSRDLYAKAIAAFKSYSGIVDEDDDDEEL